VITLIIEWNMRRWLYYDYAQLPFVGWAVIAGVFFIGVFFLSRREGYPPADRADRRLRRWLRLAALAPLLAIALEFATVAVRIYEWVQLRRAYATHNYNLYYGISSIPDEICTAFILAGFFVATVGTAPLPLLLFRHLRGLAKRARSAQLAEHCTIVGIGTAASLLYVAGAIELFENAPMLGLGDYWVDRSSVPLALMLILGVAAALFTLWCVYLLLRFTMSFVAAARDIRPM
jgi:hypothetical protein